MKSLFAALALLIMILAGLTLIPRPDFPDTDPTPLLEVEEAVLVPYVSTEFGIAFTYPEGYFTNVTGHDGERLQSTVTLFEDTPFTRALVNGEAPGTEAPPSISIAMFQNDLDKYSAESFIRDNSNSNFKLSDGTLVPVVVGGIEGLAYQSTGLYENDNIVIARPDFVYLFTVGYHSHTDRIRTDFKTVIDSVAFDPVSANSAEGAPEGSMHNLPVPTAVAAAKKRAATDAKAAESSAIILSAIEREWPDACLGLANADEMCAQVITPGYAVSVQVAGAVRAYRTNADGSEVREE